MSARWTFPADSGFSRHGRSWAYKRISIQPIEICLSKMDTDNWSSSFPADLRPGEDWTFRQETVPARMIGVGAGFVGAGTSATLDEA